MCLQIGLQCAVIESAQSNGVGCVSVEREVTHQIDGCLKDKHQI